MEPATPPANVLGGISPILPVSDLRAAIEYYTGSLGFKLNWEHTSDFASVSRDRCNIFLCQGGQGHPGTWVYCGVNDAAALETELRAKGAKIRQPATNFPWAQEMQVEDLDGNVLRFGSEPLPDQPFGEFLDMHGRLWPVTAA